MSDNSREKATIRQHPLLKLICTVIFIISLPSQAPALLPDQIFDKVKDSVIVIKTYDDQGKLKFQGSGVILPSGKIATNCHVVEGGLSFQVEWEEKFINAKIYAEDREKDICLLDVEALPGKPVQLGKAANLRVGVPVYAIGAPMGLELSLSDGIVSQLRGGLPPLIQTTAAISPGSSGGGLFDSEGRLVGLTTLYIKGGQSLNFAMPVEWIDEIKPSQKTAATRYIQTEWLKHATALEELNDWQGLLDWCQKWIESDPENADAWFFLGDAFRFSKRYDDAIYAYHQTIHITPEDSEAWICLGSTYNMIERYNEAIKAIQKALLINKNNSVAWAILGGAYSSLKLYKDAIEAFRKALYIDPEDESAWFLLGIDYDRLEYYNEAIEAYRNALRINPKNERACLNIGDDYREQKRYAYAIDAYRQALLINPENDISWFSLGFTYVYIGDRKSALEAVRELRRLNSEWGDKLINLIK